MSEQSCSACNDLREYAPEFVVNGVTDTVCEHLANNEGLSGADGHVNCDDLHDVNDCLIGNMEDEIESFDVCEWKDFMHQYIPNNFETLKALICSMCGQWADIECLQKKMSAITVTPTVRAFRNGLNVAYTAIDNVGSESGQRSPFEIGTLKVYMDATENDTQDASPSGTYGSTPADRDYIALLTWCARAHGLDNEETKVQVSVRNNNQTVAYAQERAQHYQVKGVNSLSVNQTGFCILPKGGYLLIRQYCSECDAEKGSGQDPEFSVHQFSMVLIPIVTNSIEC